MWRTYASDGVVPTSGDQFHEGIANNHSQCIRKFGQVSIKFAQCLIYHQHPLDDDILPWRRRISKKCCCINVCEHLCLGNFYADPNGMSSDGVLLQPGDVQRYVRRRWLRLCVSFSVYGRRWCAHLALHRCAARAFAHKRVRAAACCKL